ncbi:MAG: hypothetical protein HDR06_12205 [Lachnospiraceae bacterium]|nr:hypothetical protein [Lachnospiraceae bacterium]
MKREELEKLGLTKEQIDKVCDLNNADVQPLKSDLEKLKADLKAEQDKVATTEEALKKFEGVDAEALKKQIDDLKADLKKKDEEHTAELANRDFDALLKDSITSAKGRNAKAIAALLDMETLKASKNQKEDMAAALKQLAEAEDSKMLFGDPEAGPAGTGNLIGTVTKSSGVTDDAALRAAMGLPPVAEQK